MKNNYQKFNKIKNKIPIFKQKNKITAKLYKIIKYKKVTN
jgi:hypothetical protein